MKCVFRNEIEFSLIKIGFSYLYGSISHLFGCEKKRCFSLMNGYMAVGYLLFLQEQIRHHHPRRALSALATFGGNDLFTTMFTAQMASGKLQSVEYFPVAGG
jgi:hypothetical protein